MPDYDVITYTRPDSVVVNLSDPPYMLNGHDGFGIGELVHTMVAPPGLHGSYWFDTRMEPKVVSVDFSVFREGVVERTASRRDLVRAFNPLLGPGILRLDQVNDISVEMVCILAESFSMPTDSYMGPGGARWTARFISHGVPALRLPTINTQAFSTALVPGNFTFPWSFPKTLSQSGYYANLSIENEGDIDVPVHITMIGPLINPVFKNVTTGKTLAMTGLSLLAGQQLDIDTDPNNLTVKINGLDSWQYLTQEASFWMLAPGVNNILFDIGGTTSGTSGVLSWYTYYLGT